MAGWVVVLFDDDLSVGDLCNAKFTWRLFAQEVRQFLHRAKEAHRRELLLEKYASDPSQPPKDFLREHLHHLIGWGFDSLSRIHLRFPLNDSSRSFEVDIPVSKLSDTTPRIQRKVHSHVNIVCRQFLIGLNLIHKASLLGQTRVSHGIIRTVDQALSSTAQVAQAVLDLKQRSPFLMPSATFNIHLVFIALR